MALNKELLLKTADALESGKFQQSRRTWGYGRLNPKQGDDGFCCLHVLLAVASGTTEDNGDCHYRMRQVPKEEVVKDGVYDRGFYIENVSGLTSKHIADFIEMNDKFGMSFQQIAGKMRELATSEEKVQEVA